MRKIQELSEQLANQIAAGEVIERPASVVKELIENAIDAKSTQIDVLVEESGLKKIQVIDNGEGIEKEDVAQAFKRHATSKIHTRDDLFRIRSLGFRGEALPSIASVSEVTIETATAAEEEGSYLYLKGGKIEETRPAALRKGTKITVTNLFFNTPARLKYVKSLQTELANIGDVINRLALSHPQIAFRFSNDGNLMMRTTGLGDLKQTVAGIYGISVAKKMIPIQAEDLDFRLRGYFSLPELTRASRNYISIIINGRYIKNFLLNKAIISGYGSKLMVGRFPIAVLEITMDPLLVDVNVHPTKQEVRLSKEQELQQLIIQAIREALQEKQLIPRAIENVRQEEKKVTPEVSEQLAIPLSPVRESANQAEQKTEHLTPPFVAAPTKSELIEESVATFDTQTKEEQARAPFPELTYFGQMHGTYLFAQSPQGLYIIDQHAAQERIKYEYFREQIGQVSEDLQVLLVPIVLEYPSNDALKLMAQQDLLTQVGIHLEDFGQYTFVVRKHPTWYPKGQEEETIREMLDMLLTTGSITVKKFREKTAIMMSCKQSIKANHYLDDAQARALLHDLALCENPFNCPHGRPVLIHFTNKDMEKMFKRIQDSHA